MTKQTAARKPRTLKTAAPEMLDIGLTVVAQLEERKQELEGLVADGLEPEGKLRQITEALDMLDKGELLMLNAKATELAKLGADDKAPSTLQAPSKGLGLAWRAAGHKAPNTRCYALAAIQAAYPNGCTVEQAVSALSAAAKAGLNLGSGTPRSYVKAFVANGYLA